VIRQEIKEFIGYEKPSWWAYFAAWDFQLLVRLMGGWNNFPVGWPLYVNDLRAFMDWNKIGSLPPQTGTKHNALEDAKWNFQLYKYIISKSDR
jgi:hypothetical protein